MKSVVKIDTANKNAFMVACAWAGVTVKSGKAMGPKTGFEVVHSAPDQLVEIGGLLKTLTPEDVKTGLEQIAADAKASVEKKAKAVAVPAPGKK